MSMFAFIALQRASEKIVEIKFPLSRVIATSLVVKPGKVATAELKFTCQLRDVSTVKKLFANCKVPIQDPLGSGRIGLRQEGQYFTFSFPLATSAQGASEHDYSRALAGCAIRYIEFVSSSLQIVVDQWQSPESLKLAFPNQSFLQSESKQEIAIRRAGKFDRDGVRFFVSSTSNGIVDSSTGRLSFLMLSQTPLKK